MSRVNKILTLFILILTLVFVFLWRGLQTDRFGKIISNKVKSIIEKKTSYHVSFERIEVKLFPPTTVMRTVKISDGKRVDFDIQADALGISFGLSDLFSPNLSIGELFIANAEIHIPLNAKKDAVEKADTNLNIENLIKTLFSNYTEFYSSQVKVEIKKISASRTSVHYGDNIANVDKLNLFLYPNLLVGDAIIGSESSREYSLPEIEHVAINFQLTDKNFRLKELTIYDGIDELNIKGKINLKKAALDMTFSYKGGVNEKIMSLAQTLPQEIKTLTGFFDINGKIKGHVLKPQVALDLNIQKLVSDYAKLDRLNIKTVFENGVISVDKLKLYKGYGSTELKGSYKLFDVNNNKLLLKSFLVESQNFYSNDFLYSIRDILDSLKFYYSGTTEIIIGKNSIRFKPETSAMIDKMRLVDSANRNILRPSSFSWISGKGVTVNFDGGVNLDGVIDLDGSIAVFGGDIGEELSLELQSEKLDFEKVGPIAEVDIKGVGPLKLSVSGPGNDVIFKSNFELDDFSVIGINFGKIIGTGNFSLKDLRLDAMVNKGTFNQSVYKGGGSIVFEGNNNLNLDINIINGHYNDLQSMIPDVLAGIKNETKNLESFFTGKAKIYGGFGNDEIAVSAKVKGGGSYWSEVVDTYSFDLSYQKELLSIDSIKITKGQGKIFGGFIFDSKNEGLNYSFKIQSLRLSDIQYLNKMGLGYDGVISGTVNGTGDTSDSILDGNLKIEKGTVGDIAVRDSLITVFKKKEGYYFGSNLLGGELVANAFIEAEKSTNKQSYLNLSLNKLDIRKILGILSIHNLSDKSMSGVVDLELTSKFDPKHLLKMDADLKMNSFAWKKSKYTLQSNTPGLIKIENGAIKKWNLDIGDMSNFIRVNATGNLAEKVRIESDYHIPCVFADIISEDLSFIDGSIDGRVRLVGDGGEFYNYIEVSGKKISLKVLSIRNLITNLNFNSLVDGDRISIAELDASFGGGKITAHGQGKLAFPYPQLDILVNAESIRYPLFKKSSINFDANINLRGAGRPYDIIGKAMLKESIIRDELNDLREDGAADQGHLKYIPKSSKDKSHTMANLNILVMLKDPLEVKNSLLDMKFNGELTIKNNISRPLYNGALEIAKFDNKLLLKGHEFDFSEGRIDLVAAREEQIINLNFLANSKINNYDVITKVNGPTSNINIDMYSRPELSQGDLLSLITLGLTNEATQSLNEKERQSVTTLGIGGLFFDQLGINQNLKKNFGLKLSVAPEIEQDDGSLLRGRVENSGTESNLKTGTKIQVKKNLAEKVGLSLSSTVGGVAKQKQEMNIDVKINDSLSLEGVYEIRSSEDVDEESPDSVGADLKWRFSF